MGDLVENDSATGVHDCGLREAEHTPPLAGKYSYPYLFPLSRKHVMSHAARPNSPGQRASRCSLRSPSPRATLDAVAVELARLMMSMGVYLWRAASLPVTGDGPTATTITSSSSATTNGGAFVDLKRRAETTGRASIPLGQS